jgi:hypothetical protein
MAPALTTKSQWFVVVLLLSIVIAALTIFTANVLAPSDEQVPFDFTPRYVGTKAIWAGENPYADTVTSRIQNQMFGRTLPEGIDEQRFAYPAYIAVFLAPFTLLPARMAVSLWMAFQFVSVLIVPFIWLYILRWHVRPLATIAMLVGIVLVFRFPINNYLVANFTGSMLLFISLALLALREKRDTLAGVLFAIATVPPTVSVPLAMLILGAYALSGRWRGLLSFIATLAAASVITILLVGWWIPDFLQGLSSYTEYAHPVWAVSLIPPYLGIVLLFAVLVVCVMAVVRFCKSPTPQNELILIAVVIPSVLILVPQTGNYYLTLLIPAVLIAAQASKYRAQGAALFGLAMVSPWLIPQGMETLLLPLLVLVAWVLLNAKELGSFFGGFLNLAKSSH